MRRDFYSKFETGLAEHVDVRTSTDYADNLNALVSNEEEAVRDYDDIIKFVVKVFFLITQKAVFYLKGRVHDT